MGPKNIRIRIRIPTLLRALLLIKNIKNSGSESFNLFSINLSPKNRRKGTILQGLVVIKIIYIASKEGWATIPDRDTEGT